MKNIRSLLYGLLVTSLSALPSGCNNANRPKAENGIVQNPARLIVTNSDAYEMLLGLGAADNIAGISDIARQSFAGEVEMPSIGNWRNPNIEAIINLKPDVVVTYNQWPDLLGFDNKLQPFGIKVERIDCTFISEYHSDISRLAALVGKANVADSMIADFDGIVNTIKTAVAGITARKRVYFEFSDFSAMGAGTANNEMLELINAVNIAAPLKIQYPKISTEWLLEENPDMIVKVVTADNLTVDMYDKLVARAGWDKLDAVRNGQVYLISTELCSGPRAMIGCLYLGKWCYPDRFAAVNPDSVHAGWLQKYYGVAPHNIYSLIKR